MKRLILLLLIIAGLAVLATAASGQSGQGPEDPNKQEWARNLNKALALERLSLSQYTADSEKFNISMPYRVVIPQVEDHIQALIDLMNTKGISPQAEAGPATKTRTIDQAYRVGTKLDRDLITLYEWLIRNGEDPNSAAVLTDILTQTRRHLMLFEHGQKAGRGMGAETGPSWMQR